MRAPKYLNKHTFVGKIKFASKREAARYVELKAMEAAGLITGLELQKKYLLIPAQYQERKVTYIADFDYVDADLNPVTEDVKGFRTAEYVIKRKLMLWVHCIKIKEVF